MTDIAKTAPVSIAAPCASVQTSPSTPATDKTLVLVFKNGQIIMGWQNGFETRGERHINTIDPHHRNYGPKYWANYAMKELELTPNDIVMRCVGGEVKFF